jgi:hypothetical protein
MPFSLLVSGRAKPSRKQAHGALGGVLALSTVVLWPVGASYATASPARLTGASKNEAALGNYGPNVCKLLPGREMASLIRQPVSRTADRPWSLLVSVAPDRYARGNQCKYITPNDTGSPSVLVMLVVTEAASNYRLALKGEFETPTTVPRLAKQAFFDTANGLYALWRRYEIEVSGTPSQNEQSMSQNVAIAKALMKALG